MKIGILGSGNMGRAIGMVWAEMGHEIFFGDIDQHKAQAVAHFVNQCAKAAAQPLAQSGPVGEAAQHGQVLLHTARDVMLSAMLPAVALLRGKVVIDCNNEASTRLFEERVLSHAERLAQDAPQVHIVKAFNTISQETFEHCPLAIQQFQVSCFVAGDHKPAVNTVMRLAQEMGLVPVDCGLLRNARLLEVFGDFIRVMIKMPGGGPDHALCFQPLPPCPQPRLGGHNPKLKQNKGN